MSSKCPSTRTRNLLKLSNCLHEYVAHSAADNHTHVVNTETREKQLYYYCALADDRTLVSAMPVNESNLGDQDSYTTFN